MYWKQELVQREPRLAQLVDQPRESFDETTFLYDLYKTSTVKEIDDFKATLIKLQNEVL